jgi:hypothetical protein
MATDADGDVEMTVPQPVFEVVQPPKLSAWDQASLISWVRQRRQYEAKIRNRCAVTSEQYEHVVTSIRNSMEPRILEHLARFVLKKPAPEVTDEDLGLAITRRCSSLQNSHILDMEQLFKDRLTMDLKIEDTEARVLNSFVLFDQIVEEHGLGGLLGSGQENDANYQDRMKLRCKLLLQNIAPEMLRLELERLAIARPVLKKDDVALYEALVDRSREQQHYHMLAQELKQGEKSRSQSKSKATSGSRPPPTKVTGEQRVKQREIKNPSKPSRKEATSPRAPPRDGCLVCGGAHWVKQCPSASETDKEDALRRMNDLKNQRLQAKAVRSMVAPGERSAILNGVLEVPFCADTGADCNVVTRRIAQELVKLDSTVAVEKMATPVDVEVADGRPVRCTEQFTMDVQLLTAAGPVRLRRVNCVVMDGDSEEVLIGDATLKTLGINVDQLLEQLAAKVEPEEDEDDIDDEDIVGTTDSSEVTGCLDAMLQDAVKEGFPKELVQDLRDAVNAEVDIWRTKLGADPPAKLEPLRVVLVDGAVPYRTKPRQYSAAKTKFLREYGKQLEKFKLVFRNNQSRWACAAIPVR